MDLKTYDQFIKFLDMGTFNPPLSYDGRCYPIEMKELWSVLNGVNSNLRIIGLSVSHVKNGNENLSYNAESTIVYTPIFIFLVLNYVFRYCLIFHVITIMSYIQIFVSCMIIGYVIQGFFTKRIFEYLSFYESWENLTLCLGCTGIILLDILMFLDIL